jgi:hypothetical protein
MIMGIKLHFIRFVPAAVAQQNYDVGLYTAVTRVLNMFKSQQLDMILCQLHQHPFLIICFHQIRLSVILPSPSRS